MKMKNKKNKFNANEALNFESSRKDLITKSNKIAWSVTLGSSFITLLLALAIYLMLPLKTVELRVVKVDKNGMVDILYELDETKIKTSEATDKHFVSEYVKTREQYYYETLAKDYETVMIMSSEKVGEDYSNLYSGKNGRQEILKDRNIVKIKILSVVLAESQGTKIATVRMEITKKQISSGTQTKSIKVITLAYDYIPLKQKEEQLFINPMGFIVTTYRKDREVN